MTYGQFKIAKWNKEWLEKWDKEFSSEMLSKFTLSKCLLCEVDFQSVTMAQSHYQGKKHKMTIKRLTKKHGFNAPDSKLDKEKDYCKICQVSLTSSVMANIHLAGKKHKKRLQITRNPKRKWKVNRTVMT